MKIKKIIGRQVLDSRGFPTVECEIHSDDGKIARAMVPSGMSTGTYEALELRDKEKEYGGKGVLNAVSNINKVISPKLKGMELTDFFEMDAKIIALDGTKNKSHLGANAVLGASMALCRLFAMDREVELFEFVGILSGKNAVNLPVPFANVINGGVHAGTNLKIQEFMIAPIRAKSFSDAARIISETYFCLKKILKDKYGNSAVNVGDEGGFAPPLQDTNQALELLSLALEDAGYSKEAGIAMDCAASEFFVKGKYELDGKLRSEGELTDYYIDLISKYKLISIEDPFQEDQFGSFAKLNSKIGKKVQIIGDDLTVTNIDRISKAVSEKSANCLLLKVNQIGSISESLNASKLAYKNKWNVMVSHRSGETEDAFISDFAVGIGCRQIKLGAIARGERTAKYNQLLRIEEMLGSRAKYGWI